MDTASVVSQLDRKKTVTGLVGLGIIILAYAAMYALNYILPLRYSNYTTRLWDWSRLALTLAALVVVFQKRNSVKPGAVWIGFVLGAISALSRTLDGAGILTSILEGFGVLVCFVGGVTLFRSIKAFAVPAFEASPGKIVLSILFGIGVAIPLTVLNNLYFYMNAGEIQFQNLFVSALEALSPAIHEEIIFRFFVLALCFSFLPPGASSLMRMGLALFLAVVPHSMNHLPDLFMQNPLMGLFMLVATSLLFGLPMALLQVKKNLESAIAFHWFIDFIRFIFGF